MATPIYVLGTGLSHDGSAVLLKDGEVWVAIEKERITRRKHDGGNDTLAIQYCLDAAGITLNDVAVIVQCANFEIPRADRHQGKRLFFQHDERLFNISHHLAHAYSAAGTCPFDDCVIMVIDGAGSPYQQCIDLNYGEIVPTDLPNLSKETFWCEKDSFYFFDGKEVKSIFKDFSEFDTPRNNFFYHQSTKHSIGGFYSSISRYVFRDMDDVGKLMGLAPYGRSGQWSADAFIFKEGCVFVDCKWQELFNRPCKDHSDFKTNFQYYADVARWAQEQVEKAVSFCFEERLSKLPHDNVCFSGGVALNAVANAVLLNTKKVKNLYLEPAAGDNGLALGCAYYGWMQVLNKAKVTHNGNTCFGKPYTSAEIQRAVEDSSWPFTAYTKENELIREAANLLAKGKTIAWFQEGAEFGPRALGHRSILAHPGIPGLKDHINQHIKFREDFRPFAPSILPEYADVYFESGRSSPYMILVDKTKEQYLDQLVNVTHVDGTARVQTVNALWNKRFASLLEGFRLLTGLPVLLNTSFNKKGMPMVETPGEAIALFTETALDVLVLENVMLKKDKSLQSFKKKNTDMNTATIKHLKLPFEFDRSLLLTELRCIEDRSWIAHYNQADYSGSWTTLALYSKDGSSSSIYASMDAASLKPTEIMNFCPYIREVLDTFQFEKLAVRLMRLNVGAVIKPHRDNALGYEDGDFRLHIPIVTNPDVNFILGGERIVMDEGTCWYINANEEHSVTNEGTTDRIHLVIDGKRNEWTDQIFYRLAPEASFIREEKKMPLNEQLLMMEELKRMNTPAALSILEGMRKNTI
uniref:carbamoyltransferase C-terminal domain-containing protein n=1 Tax=Pedobacter schmidteae TaxID=2201271 RepID=UPI000EAFB027|nr:carbamoyltransferase C-terminal domain-containing protein [Pedobacter schmidteae]